MKEVKEPSRKDGVTCPRPLPLRCHPYYKKRTINVISGGFTSRGERSGVMEVYATNIPTGVMLRKRPRPMETNTISFSDEDLGHVASPHKDALVITKEVDGYDVKRILVNLGSPIDAFSYMHSWVRGSTG